MSQDPSPNDALQRLTLLQAAFDEIPDVIVLKDAQGDFLLCNQTVARLYNTTPEAMVGKHDDDFGVPKEIADGFRRNVLDIMARGQTEVVLENSRDAVTGEIRHFKSIKKPFKDAQGRNQILVIAHDITDIITAQQQVAASERRLQDVLAATQEGIWDWHVPSGRVFHNANWYRLLGFDAGDIDDTVDAFAAHLHPEDRPAVWQKIQDLLAGRSAVYRSEHRMLCKDGTVIWVLDRGRVAERDAQGQPLRVVGAFSDITQRRHDQAALEHALHLAQSATRAKSDFLATMSHELRTPLNGVLGMAQLLQDDDVSPDERKEYARIILESGQTLLGLLNDILDLSKVESGKLVLELAPVQPRNVIEPLLPGFAEQARRKGIALTHAYAIAPERCFEGDVLRLRQMVSNYLGNAIKFTARGTVHVELGTLQDERGQTLLECAVQDSGIGIAPDKQALLFQPFTQADNSTTRRFGGTGLGLSIVARLAELMGGGVGLSSQEGTGSRFWFRIPVRWVDDAPGAPSNAAVPTAAVETVFEPLQGRVLVAEDNPVNRTVIAALLEGLGVRPDFVEDGQGAVNWVLQRRPADLILMDIQMPVLSGVEACRQIRQWEAAQGARRLPVLALTAGAFAEDRRLCQEAGMDDFLAKPVDRVHLYRALRRWLAR
ncbi:MAG: hypothetical protein OHK0048_25700 [Rhodoferax sp.]